MKFRLGTFLAFVALSAALSACNSGGGGMTESLRSVRGGTPDPEVQDFVRESRPATPVGYIPVGITPPGRATPVRSAADVEKLEKELSGQRDRTRAFANRPKPQPSYDGSVPRPGKASQGMAPQKSE